MTRTVPLLLTLLAALGTASSDSDRSLKLGVIAELTGDIITKWLGAAVADETIFVDEIASPTR